MLIALWIINGLLALAFLASGSMKLASPKDALYGRGMTYVEDFSTGTIKAIGAAQVLGALGLVLPLATHIAPVLTPIAAAALAIIMVGAIVVHVRRKEQAVPAIVLAVLAIASTILGATVVFA